jgi:cellulose synthase/poly-beta-1,6-N-acetylglucosamine synthase-like glycosyltransferase
MFTLFCALSAIMICEAALTFLKVRRFRDFYLRKSSESLPLPDRWPRVALLAPCKGIEPNLRENIDSWLAQDYPDYRLFFILESDKDPAYNLIRTMNGNVLIAGEAHDSGQKVHNLRYAIDQLPDSFEVLAFVDSDCFVEKDWLKRLVAQIVQSPENAATGYRWFTYQKDFGSFLRAVWNSGVLTLYQDGGKHNFAWGGSMAIMRSSFESFHVRDHWQGSISDDYGLTNAMQSAGKSVEFVPGVIGWTRDSISTLDFFRWAFRQLLITRVYHRRLWLAALLFHGFWLIWILNGFLYPLYFIPAFLVVQFFQGCKADLRLQCVPVGNRFLFWFSGPLIGFCNALLLIATLFTRTVVWRGRKYVLRGKNRVSIVGA